MKNVLDDRLGTPPPHPDVQAWLAQLEPPERTELERTWALAELGRELEPDAQNVQDAWTALQHQRVSEAQPAKPTPAFSHTRQTGAADRVSHRRRAGLRWAGAVVAVSVIGLVAIGWLLRGGVEHVEAPFGETLTHRLPDGSTVVLNSGTTLTYQRTWRGNERRLHIEGEAYFDVQTEERPFVVETFNAEVTVLGTQFNVQAWSATPDAETVVVLEEGRVRLGAPDAPEQSVVLRPGQMSRLGMGQRQPTAPAAVDVTRALAWRSGGFFFNNKSLLTILAEVERRFDVSIHITDETIAQDSLVLFLHQADSPDVLLKAIQQFRGYRFRATEAGYDVLPTP